MSTSACRLGAAKQRATAVTIINPPSNGCPPSILSLRMYAILQIRTAARSTTPPKKVEACRSYTALHPAGKQLTRDSGGSMNIVAPGDSLFSRRPSLTATGTLSSGGRSAPSVRASVAKQVGVFRETVFGATRFHPSTPTGTFARVRE